MIRPFVCIRKGPELAGRRRDVRLRLLPSEKELSGGGHHLRGPHWLEGKLGVDGLDALDGESLGLDLFLDQVSYRTHGARQAKAHVHMTPVVVYPNIVDQTQLHQVHPDLRVYDVPQLVPDTLLGQHSLTSRRLLITLPLDFQLRTLLPITHPNCKAASDLFHSSPVQRACRARLSACYTYSTYPLFSYPYPQHIVDNFLKARKMATFRPLCTAQLFVDLRRDGREAK